MVRKQARDEQPRIDLSEDRATPNGPLSRLGLQMNRMQTDVETIQIEGGVLGELYLRHAPQALRLAYLLTGDPRLSEDLVQDAFVRLAGRMLHLRSPDGFHAYLRITVVNLVRSYRRRKSVEATYLERRTASIAVDPPDLSDRVELRSALMALPLRQRTAIVLRYYEDLSDAQTAEVMRCRRAAVKSLVARGMVTLRSSVRKD
jgi:RNA polymerase sigma factor (sigma-70 family)